MAKMLPTGRPDDEPNLKANLFRIPSASVAGPQWHERVSSLEAALTPGVCRRLGIYALPDDFLLSVVIPVYNEERTLATIVQQVRDTQIPCEIILVNDGSSDGSAEILEELQSHPEIKVVTHKTNQGKGAALRSGFSHVGGSVVIVQDADLEYDPSEYMRLIQPILEGEADVVYGSRFSSPDHRIDHFWHQNGNRLITLISNLFTNLKLTDVETCYKVFRRELIQEIAPTLVEKGFGVELEITSKLARKKNVRFYERPISYRPRSYDEGKKISWRDAVRAIWCVMKY